MVANLAPRGLLTTGKRKNEKVWQGIAFPYETTNGTDFPFYVPLFNYSEILFYIELIRYGEPTQLSVPSSQG